MASAPVTNATIDMEPREGFPSHDERQAIRARRRGQHAAPRANAVFPPVRFLHRDMRSEARAACVVQRGAACVWCDHAVQHATRAT